MEATVPRRRVIIMGAAGRDFHNFNVVYRDDERYEVVAFTATQIPGIEGRTYPRELAGHLYPDGIPIYPEADLEDLIRRLGVDQVDFAYSDLAHVEVMHKASRVLSSGADFSLVGPKASMLESDIPVIAACAVRTGAGKSQTTRAIARILNKYGKKIAAIRHPMPYGDLVKMRMQRFDSYDDLAAADCTIEEREEYEPHLAQGSIVYAGVDYEEILRNAEKEADVILWDGGNNDFSFYRPDLNITVADPLRAGHEMLYHPGETNLRMADVVVINKVDSALPGDVMKLRKTIGTVNPTAVIVEARSAIKVENDTPLEGKRVLVVEDGPTLTHGEMGYGAGVVLARRAGATLVNPRPWAAGSIKDVYSKFPHIGALLPAMGYSPEQRKDLEDTINASDADIVLIGSPIDLRSICDLNKPAVRVFYELEVIGEPSLETVIKERLGLSNEGGA
jgi:predicted GTPase